MDEFDHPVRFHVECDSDLVIHPVPCICQRTLILCIQVLAFLGKLLGMSEIR